MTAPDVDALPRVIRTEAENERMIAALERLDTLGRPLTPEESEVAELMTALIQQFEREHYPIAVPISPGEILREEFIEPAKVRLEELAADLELTVTELEELIKGARDVTPELAQRLARRFGTTAEFWTNLEAAYIRDKQTVNLGDTDRMT